MCPNGSAEKGDLGQLLSMMWGSCPDNSRGAGDGGSRLVGVRGRRGQTGDARRGASSKDTNDTENIAVLFLVCMTSVVM